MSGTADRAQEWLSSVRGAFVGFYDTAEAAECYLQQLRLTAKYERPGMLVLPTDRPWTPADERAHQDAQAEVEYYDDGSPDPVEPKAWNPGCPYGDGRCTEGKDLYMCDACADDATPF